MCARTVTQFAHARVCISIAFTCYNRRRRARVRTHTLAVCSRTHQRLFINCATTSGLRFYCTCACLPPPTPTPSEGADRACPIRMIIIINSHTNCMHKNAQQQQRAQTTCDRFVYARCGGTRRNGGSRKQPHQQQQHTRTLTRTHAHQHTKAAVLSQCARSR